MRRGKSVPFDGPKELFDRHLATVARDDSSSWYPTLNCPRTPDVTQRLCALGGIRSLLIGCKDTDENTAVQDGNHQTTWHVFCEALRLNRFYVEELFVLEEQTPMTPHILHMIEQLFHAMAHNKTIRRFHPGRFESSISTMLRDLLCARTAPLELNLCLTDVSEWNDESFSLAKMKCLHQGWLKLEHIPPAWYAVTEPLVELKRVELDWQSDIELFMAELFVHRRGVAPPALSGHEMQLQRACGFFHRHLVSSIHIDQPNSTTYHQHILSSISMSRRACCQLMAFSVFEQRGQGQRGMQPLAQHTELDRTLIHCANNLRIQTHNMLIESSGGYGPWTFTTTTFPMLQTMTLPTFDHNSFVDSDSLRKAVTTYLGKHAMLTHVVLDPTGMKTEDDARATGALYAHVFAEQQLPAFSVLRCAERSMHLVRIVVQQVLAHPRCSIRHIWIPQQVAYDFARSRCTTLVSIALSRTPATDPREDEETDGHRMMAHDPQTLEQFPNLLSITPVDEPLHVPWTWNCKHWVHAYRHKTYYPIRKQLQLRQATYIHQRDAWQQFVARSIWNKTLAQHPLRDAIGAWLPTLRVMTGGARARPWERCVPDLAYAGVYLWPEEIEDHDWLCTIMPDEIEFWKQYPIPAIVSDMDNTSYLEHCC